MGAWVGALMGEVVGFSVGAVVGFEVGIWVGKEVGFCVGRAKVIKKGKQHGTSIVIHKKHQCYCC